MKVTLLPSVRWPTVFVSGDRVTVVGAGVPVGLSLWRTEGPLRVVGHSTGLQRNGDIYDSATMNALGCPGTMQLTLVSKQ